MSYLYVNEQGARIGVDGGYITVQMKNDLLRKIPSETLHRKHWKISRCLECINYHSGYAEVFETRNNIKFLLF